MSTPIANASRVRRTKAACDSVAQNHTVMPTRTRPTSAFNGCCPGNTTGRPETSPCSLTKATTEPEKVTAPIAEPSDISTRLATARLPVVPMP